MMLQSLPPPCQGKQPEERMSRCEGHRLAALHARPLQPHAVTSAAGQAIAEEREARITQSLLSPWHGKQVWRNPKSCHMLLGEEVQCEPSACCMSGAQRS